MLWLLLRVLIRMDYDILGSILGSPVAATPNIVIKK